MKLIHTIFSSLRLSWNDFRELVEAQQYRETVKLKERKI